MAYDGMHSGPSDPDYNRPIQKRVPETTVDPGQSLQEQIERKANQREYKARCEEPPPQGLDACERAKWELAKAKDCKALRKANTDRWWGGQDTRHSPQLARDLELQIQDAERAIARHCPKTCP